MLFVVLAVCDHYILLFNEKRRSAESPMFMSFLAAEIMFRLNVSPSGNLIFMVNGCRDTLSPARLEMPDDLID